MSVEVDIRYLTVTLFYGRRYEVYLRLYDDRLNRCRYWSTIAFTARPTARQIRAAKKRFYRNFVKG